MHFLLLSTCALSLCLTLSAALTKPAALTSSGVRFLPGGYIVELASSETDREINFYTNITNNNIAATPRMTLAHTLFDGLSFTLAPGHDNVTSLSVIESFSAVKKLWPIRLYDAPTPTVSSTFSDARVGDDGEGSLLRKREDPNDIDVYLPHVMGGIDKLRAEGYDGEGIFVGIVDTGVDYNHPALGGGFGEGFKVVTGYDLVGDDYDGSTTPIPDGDPMDCLGHGTHVSGIVGASYDPLGFSGVVPNATLGMWKVFGCYDATATDVLIAGFNLAYEAGVDLITCSIGGRNGWSEDPWDVAVQRIMDAGVPCTIAAGNDGVNGLFDSSGAGDSIGAISVGSIDSLGSPVDAIAGTYEMNGISTTFGYDPATYGDFGNTTALLYAVSLDTTVVDDACSAFPPTTPDLSDYVVLIQRGTCTFDTKVANAVAFGAKQIIFYNNVDGILQPQTTSPNTTSALVTNNQGVQWISALISGLNITLTFISLAESPGFAIQIPNTISGGFMSTYTSWSPTNELHIKPEVSAPGGNILSTWPIALGSYAVLSGTSMATPYIAGVVALLKQVRGAITPEEAATLLSTTAKPVLFNDGSGTYTYIAPTIQQGGGMVDAYAAAHSVSTLDIKRIELNDTTRFTPSHFFTIFNAGTVPVIYELEHIAAATAYAFQIDMVDVPIPEPEFPPVMTTDYATITFSSPTLTIPAGSSAIVTAVFTPPTGLNASQIPVYSGYISINGSNGDILSLPYAGALGDMTALDLFSGSWNCMLYDESYATILDNDTFTLAGANSTYTPSRYIEISWVSAIGTRLMRVDIVPNNTAGLDTQTVLGREVLGLVPGYPAYDVPAQSGPFEEWDGQYVDSEGVVGLVPEGKYQFLFRGLRIFGDEEVEADYQEEESVWINVLYF